MACLRCHRDVAPDASYCPACGAQQFSGTVPNGATRRLVRIPSEGRLAGVCAGIADYLDVDVTLIRILWIALSIIPGAIVGGILAYVLAWIVMPEGAASRAVSGKRLTRAVADAKIAGVCVGIANYFGVDATPVRVLWIVLSVMPGAIIGGLCAYLAAWLIVPKEPTIVGQQQPHAA